jgi:hypothetical protein
MDESTPSTPPLTPEPAPSESLPASHKKLLIGLIILVALMFAMVAILILKVSSPKKSTVEPTAVSNATRIQSSAQKVAGLQLDPAKNYGNKYGNGILPVGDGKYKTDAAQKGYVYACGTYAQNLTQSQGGAQTRGPWFVGTTQWDINKKVSVQGSINWTPSLTNVVQDGKRLITSNDLPNHHTGVFPISSNDPAYTYDRNPNSISAQSLSYDLSASPSYGNPQCESGQVGIMLTGAELFNGFDAGGRDAAAWEIQDSCQGHPEKTGTYHYHSLSSCIKDVSVKTVIGFALDGSPITGPKVGDNNMLTTNDLDGCHGIVSPVVLDSKTVTSYHYVMTQDFPYSISCFRATPVQPPRDSASNAQQLQSAAPSASSQQHLPPGPASYR